MNGDFLVNIMRGTYELFGNLSTWLNTDLFNGLTPLSILLGSGLFVVIGLHVFKLINPLS